MLPKEKLEDEDFADFEISRDRDQFLRELLRELAITLEQVVGIEEASGFISTVGGRMSDMMNEEYRSHAGVKNLSKAQIAKALVDLKRRIEGHYRVVSISDDEIVLVGTQCPFGDLVKGCQSLCMMTSNVFGKLAAENTGYAEVAIQKSIATGDSECHVTVSFKPGRFSPDEINTREYYSTE